MKIHVGCGKRDFGTDWIHVDGERLPHILHHDVINLPAENNSVDLIYSSHLLSYFDVEEGLYVLKRWNEKLKPGGILRIAVPDFDGLCRAYLVDHFPIENVLGPLYGKMTCDGKYIYHKTAYDHRFLSRQLSRAGFSRIKKYDWRKTHPHDKIDDHSQSYLPDMNKDEGELISLNLEATK